MKNALLVAPTLNNRANTGLKNIGDYIQSLAGGIFFDTIDEYIDREKLAEYKSDTEKTRMIMNAWYMWFPENWPPSDDILPLLISMHISPINASQMLTSKSIDYFKKHGPVGCRDKATEKLLQRYDIPCYFSGCLTLTLGEKYKAHTRKNNVIFVDPYFETIRNANGKLSIAYALKCLCYGIINSTKIFRLKKIFRHSCISGYKSAIIKTILSFLYISAFYKTYSGYFDDSLLFSAEYITHMVQIGGKSTLVTEESKLDFAGNLLKKYAEASLVVTSRIHCALPCLGLETPVIFITGGKLESKYDLSSSDRYDGLIDLFRVMRCKCFTLTSEDNTLVKKITNNSIITNKNNYLQIKNALLKKCHEFASMHEKKGYGINNDK